jgi:hypothetical protein
MAAVTGLCVNGFMASLRRGAAVDDGSDAPSRWKVFAVAMGFVVLSCAVPIAHDMLLAEGLLAHDTKAACGVDSCAYEGIAVLASIVFTAVVLALGAVLAGVLTVSRFRESSSRQAVTIGSVSALPGLAMTALLIMTWVRL